MKTEAKTEAKTEPKTLLQKLLDDGIPVKKVVFHQAVANGFKEPETNFSSDDPKIGRRVDMWLTDTLLICFQNERYFAVPHSNLVYVSF
jgi:hypothetical protein